MSVKPQITYHQLQQIIKKDKQVIEIKNKLQNLSSRITLVWNLLLQASQYIETFNTIIQGNKALLEKLEKENEQLYEKYKEYGDLHDDLEEDLNDVVNKITEKYIIIKQNYGSHIMSIAPGARGYKFKTLVNRKKKRNIKKIHKNKTMRIS